MHCIRFNCKRDEKKEEKGATQISLRQSRLRRTRSSFHAIQRNHSVSHNEEFQQPLPGAHHSQESLRSQSNPFKTLMKASKSTDSAFIPLLHLHPLPHHCAYSIGEDEATACRLRAILDPRSSFLLSHCDSFLDPQSQYRLVFPAVKQRFVRSIHQFLTLMNVHPVLSPLQTQQR